MTAFDQPQGWTPWTPEQRQAALDEQVLAFTLRGAHITAHGWFWAQVTTGKKYNAVLHVLLTFLTGGLWLPVALAYGIFSGERVTTFRVDEWGRVTANSRRSP